MKYTVKLCYITQVEAEDLTEAVQRAIEEFNKNLKDKTVDERLFKKIDVKRGE